MRKIVLFLTLIPVCPVAFYSDGWAAQAPDKTIDAATRQNVIEGAIKALNDRFLIAVPFARAINPITKTNWEGTGVQPDVEVPAAQAPKTAHLAALQSVQAGIQDPILADQLRSIAATTQRELQEMKSATAAGASPSGAASEGEIALPNTPAGKTFGDFLRAFNTGDAATMRRFHSDHGGDPGNADQDMGFYQQSGGLKLHGITRATDTEIEALVQSKKEGRWLSFSIEVDRNPPHGIANVRVQPASQPSAAPADQPPTTAAPTEKSVSSPARGRKRSESEMIGELEAFLAKQAADDSFSGAVLVAKDGKPIFRKAYGLANKTTGQPNRVDTKFNFGSMNKMFTAVAIAQLAEEGLRSDHRQLGKICVRHHLHQFPR
jgi:hypothetical protein